LTELAIAAEEYMNPNRHVIFKNAAC